MYVLGTEKLLTSNVHSALFLIPHRTGTISPGLWMMKWFSALAVFQKQPGNFQNYRCWALSPDRFVPGV